MLSLNSCHNLLCFITEVLLQVVLFIHREDWLLQLLEIELFGEHVLVCQCIRCYCNYSTWNLTTGQSAFVQKLRCGKLLSSVTLKVMWQCYYFSTVQDFVILGL